MQKNYYKDFTKELTTINHIENFNNYKINLSATNEEAFLTKSGRKFEINFKGVFPYSDNGEINVTIDNEPCVLQSIDFKKDADDIFYGMHGESVFDIEGIIKGNLNDSYFFKMFFFDDSDRSHIFHYKLETARHDGIIPWASECVRLTVIDKRYDITQYKIEGKSYFIIENLDTVTLEDFEKHSYAIQKGIGFLVGYMPGGQNYIFSGDSFIYRQLSRKALKSVYYPVTSNPYVFLIKKNQVADDFYGKLQVIPASAISKFVTQIYQNMELSVTIILLMEVASLKSVVSMPGIFSIILESLADIIRPKQNGRQILISDPDVRKKIVVSLNTTLGQYADVISPNATDKIGKRLNDVCRPINLEKLSNSEKLRAPFTYLNIKLTKGDEKAIEYRNDLLHGNIMMHDGTERSDKEIDEHMMYISARFFTLLSKLILKNAGYSGYVINHSKLYTTNPQIIEEDYFELI